jgi:hypothetical protein
LAPPDIIVCPGDSWEGIHKWSRARYTCSTILLTMKAVRSSKTSGQQTSDQVQHPRRRYSSVSYMIPSVIFIFLPCSDDKEVRTRRVKVTEGW